MSSNEQKLIALFDSHVNDLNNVCPGVGDIFICPICGNKFTRGDISNKKLTDGHVWPDYIRAKRGNRITKTQRVLLCQRCNSNTGSHGDKHMQLMGEVSDGLDFGNLHGERLIRLVESSSSTPINLRTDVKIESDRVINISGQIDKNGNWLRNDLEMQNRFEDLAKQKKIFSIEIHSPSQYIAPNLTIAGWITSAYLFAFYRLGYRYILHDTLAPVREYIIRSSIKSNAETIVLPASPVISFQEYKKLYFPDPELHLIIPINGKRYVHLQISFLKYQVRLPFFFVPDLLSALVYGNIPDLKERLPQLIKDDAFLYVPITINKFDYSENIYDYILGKPLNQTLT